MKLKKVALAALTAALLAALIGCLSPVDTSEFYETMNGKGRVQLNIGSPRGARTIQPDPITAAEYLITIQNTTTFAYPNDSSNDPIHNLSVTAAATVSFDLPRGNYDLTILALETAGGNPGDEFAAGTKNFNIQLGQTTPVTVNLEYPDPFDDPQTVGTFIYTIDNQVDEDGELRLIAIDVDDSTLTPGSDDDYGDFPIILTKGVTTTGTKDLVPGLYRVDVEVEIDGLKYLMSEYMYIYENMESNLSVSITAANFPDGGSVEITINTPDLPELIVNMGAAPLTGNDITLAATATSVTLTVPGGSNYIWIYRGVETSASSFTITPGASTPVAFPADSIERPLSVLAQVGGKYLSKTIMVKITP